MARGKAVCIMLMIVANVTRVFKSRSNPIEEDETTKEKELTGIRKARRFTCHIM